MNPRHEPGIPEGSPYDPWSLHRIVGAAHELRRAQQNLQKAIDEAVEHGIPRNHARETAGYRS